MLEYFTTATLNQFSCLENHKVCDLKILCRNHLGCNKGVMAFNVANQFRILTREPFIMSAHSGSKPAAKNQTVDSLVKYQTVDDKRSLLLAH